MTATWMINRLPSRVIDWKTPYEVLFGTPPDMSILRPFGYLEHHQMFLLRKGNLMLGAISVHSWDMI